jgi:hypothetical protein
MRVNQNQDEQLPSDTALAADIASVAAANEHWMRRRRPSAASAAFAMAVPQHDTASSLGSDSGPEAAVIRGGPYSGFVGATAPLMPLSVTFFGLYQRCYAYHTNFRRAKVQRLDAMKAANARGNRLRQWLDCLFYPVAFTVPPILVGVSLWLGASALDDPASTDPVVPFVPLLLAATVALAPVVVAGLMLQVRCIALSVQVEM